MKLIKYKTDYHKFILIFDYNAMVVGQLKNIQASLPRTWRDLSYTSFIDKKTGEEIRGWVFSEPTVFDRIVETLYPEVDPSAKALRDALRGESSKMESIIKLMDRGVDMDKLSEKLKVNTILPLFPFQIQAIDFVKKIGGRALIADDMGCGKTATSIGYGIYKLYNNVLIVSPASVQENWKREVERFKGLTPEILKGVGKLGSSWNIVAYSRLSKYFKILKERDWDLIIFDEAHYVKSKTAARTKVAFSLLKSNPKADVLFLTGTPIMNRPVEIYNIFNFIRHMPFWGPDGFALRYCQAQQKEIRGNKFWDLNGASNLGELKRKMFFMIKREKADVIDQLPEKTVNIMSTQMESWKDYNAIINDFRKWIIAKDLSQAALFAEALTKISYLKQVVLKNKDVSGVLRDFLEEKEKIVVFSQYKWKIKELQEEFSDIAVSLTGDTPIDDRQNIIDDFYNNPKIKLFLSTIRAGGVGINLVCADTVVFTDLSWTPADLLQAEDRLLRIGQKNNVNVYYLITPKTIEVKIWSLLRRKEKMVNAIMAGEEKVRKVHIKSLIKNL